MTEELFQNIRVLCKALKNIPGLENDRYKRMALADILLNGPKNEYQHHRSLNIHISKAQRLADQLRKDGFIRVIQRGARRAKLYDMISGALIFTIFPRLGYPADSARLLRRGIGENESDPWFFVLKEVEKIESGLGREFVPVYLEFIAAERPHVWGDHFGAAACYSILSKWKMKDESKWRRACSMLAFIGRLRAYSDDLKRMGQELEAWQPSKKRFKKTS